jgi:hypothetical protein
MLLQDLLERAAAAHGDQPAAIDSRRTRRIALPTFCDRTASVVVIVCCWRWRIRSRLSPVISAS